MIVRRIAAAVILLVPLLSGCIQQNAPAMQEPRGPHLELSISWVPYEPRTGELVTFTPHIRSSEPGDEIREILWRVEGVVLEENFLEHAFSEPGEQEVLLQVRTQLAPMNQATAVVRVLGAGAVPESSGGAPRTGGQGDVSGSSSSGSQRAPLVPPVRASFELTENVASFSFVWDRVPDEVLWTFGDGSASNESAPTHMYVSTGEFDVRLEVRAGAAVSKAVLLVKVESVPYIPHVIVGVPDSGINAYHSVYRRPALTEHPCTYILDYPCSIPALELTLDAPSWQAAFEADREKWESIRPGDRYWIPGTNIIGAVCDQPYQGSTLASTNPGGGKDYCILDDTSMHGTGTTSSVLSENPDALLVFVEGNSGGVDYLLDGVFPIDVVSYSWGPPAPLPLVGSQAFNRAPIVVAASGNEGAFPVVADGQKMHPNVYTVGAGDGATRTEPGYSGWKTTDFVSQYCRPTAQTRSLNEQRDSYCGTSFSAPTFAGALSRVILELRLQSGYTGSIVGDAVDPVLGVTKMHLRKAINHTSSYDPESPFPPRNLGVPLVSAAPYYQWGWGYYSRNDVPATLACLRDAVCPERPVDTVRYMEALWALRETAS